MFMFGGGVMDVVNLKTVLVEVRVRRPVDFILWDWIPWDPQRNGLADTIGYYGFPARNAGRGFITYLTQGVYVSQNITFLVLIKTIHIFYIFHQ